MTSLFSFLARPGLPVRLLGRATVYVLFLYWSLVRVGVAVAQPFPCVYANENGALVSVASLREVPARFRSKAVCEDKQPLSVPAAEEVALSGGVRSTSFSTSIGTMEVRWPRSIEPCFTKSPSRAISEAAAAVNRAIRSARFDAELRTRSRNWALLFIDQASAVSQFPMALSLGGHPGFMVPPNQIYIVVDYISPHCQANPDSDARLLQVLLHEMGHVLEYGLLAENGAASDRKRSEGFAAWFEGFSASFTSAIPTGRVQRGYRSMVTDQSGVGSSDFAGSGEDYGVASLEFEALVARKGVGGLMAVYATMNSERCSFYEALNKKFGWDVKVLRREVKSVSSSFPR